MNTDKKKKEKREKGLWRERGRDLGRERPCDFRIERVSRGESGGMRVSD